MRIDKGGEGKEGGESREFWHGREMEERNERFGKRKGRDVEKVAVGRSEERDDVKKRWKG